MNDDPLDPELPAVYHKFGISKYFLDNSAKFLLEIQILLVLGFIILYLSIPKDITWSNDFLILQVPDRYHSTTLVLVTAVQVMLK